MNQELRKYILKTSKSDLRILDLGFCSPRDSFCLFKEFKIKMNRTFFYTGVDICDAFNVFKGNCPHRTEIETYDIESKDWVNNFNGQICGELSEDEDYKINEESFLEHFAFHFKTNVIDYVRELSNECYFDVIILSNILHKVDGFNANILFNKCLAHLEGNGLIYVSVLASNYKNPLPEDNLFSQERYNELKEKVNVFWCEEDEKFRFELIGSLKSTEKSDTLSQKD